MDKPVVILGGGIWGSLLAYRLKQAHPQLSFKLYEQSSVLGSHKSCSFRENDCPEAMKWIQPLISQSWAQHQIKFKKFEKWVTDPYHLIDSRKLHEVVSAFLGKEILELNNKMSAELALQDAAFVIDARNICHYKKTGYRKFLSMELELIEEHNLIAPVILDEVVTKKAIFRNLQYLPLGPKTLLVKDFWYSDDKNSNFNEMKDAFNETIALKGWKVKRVLREDSGQSEIPTSAPSFRQEGRVINLAGIFHDVSGCSVPMATKLIDRMVQTSFRFGELREVVSTFRKEHEMDRQFLRFLNRLLIEQKQHQVFEVIYNQSYSLIERFSSGKLNLIDRYRIILGKSNYKLHHLLRSIVSLPNYKLSKISTPLAGHVQ
jgi:lycopene beta-cyclase